MKGSTATLKVEGISWVEGGKVGKGDPRHGVKGSSRGEGWGPRGVKLGTGLIAGAGGPGCGQGHAGEWGLAVAVPCVTAGQCVAAVVAAVGRLRRQPSGWQDAWGRHKKCLSDLLG